MPRYEYKTVPAPTKGRRGKGVRGAEARFAFALERVMNEMATEGWEYQRTETLPSTERSGLTSTSTQWRNIMIFRRFQEDTTADFAPELLPAPEAEDTPVEEAHDTSKSNERPADPALQKEAENSLKRDG